LQTLQRVVRTSQNALETLYMRGTKLLNSNV